MSFPHAAMAPIYVCFLVLYLVFLVKVYREFGGYGLIVGIVFPQITVPILAFVWRTKAKEQWLVGRSAIYWKLWAALFPFVFIGGLVYFGRSAR